MHINSDNIIATRDFRVSVCFFGFFVSSHVRWCFYSHIVMCEIIYEFLFCLLSHSFDECNKQQDEIGKAYEVKDKTELICLLEIKNY